jgi:beta-lactamase regulating signal transducer with metallopeptidase domain
MRPTCHKPADAQNQLSVRRKMIARDALMNSRRSKTETVKTVVAISAMGPSNHPNAPNAK